MNRVGHDFQIQVPKLLGCFLEVMSNHDRSHRLKLSISTGRTEGKLHPAAQGNLCRSQTGFRGLDQYLG